MQYAAKTSVTVEKSRSEIEKLVTKYGAEQFISGWNENSAVIGFTMAERQIKFILPLPDKTDQEFTYYKHSSGTAMVERAESAKKSMWEQACRQRWRALALLIKAKLEAVESGISEVEDEFLSNIVMHDGATVGQRIKPMIALEYESGKIQPLLPDYTP